MKVFLTAALATSLSVTGFFAAPNLSVQAPVVQAKTAAAAMVPQGKFFHCMGWWFSDKPKYRKYCL